MTPNAVLCDFDLTLADSSESVIECVNYALTCMGIQSVQRNVPDRRSGFRCRRPLNT